MESTFGMDPYTARLIGCFVWFAAMAAVGTLICLVAGLAAPEGSNR